MAQTADGETIGYFDGEKIIYMDEANVEQNQANEEANDSSACDVAVQTTTKPGHSYVPVFDVCMKNGNVTGFIVNDKVTNKGGIEKGVQTPDDAVQK